DREVDAGQDRVGACLGLDADVQVADLEGGHIACLQVQGKVRGSGGGHGDVDVDEHLVALDRHGVHRDGAHRGQLDGLAGAQVELRPVQPALDQAALDLAVGQR